MAMPLSVAVCALAHVAFFFDMLPVGTAAPLTMAERDARLIEKLQCGMTMFEVSAEDRNLIDGITRQGKNRNRYRARCQKLEKPEHPIIARDAVEAILVDNREAKYMDEKTFREQPGSDTEPGDTSQNISRGDSKQIIVKRFGRKSPPHIISEQRDPGHALPPADIHEVKRSQRHKRQSDVSMLWDPYVPIKYYFFDDSHVFESEEKDIMREAFAQWEECTCLTFQEIDTPITSEAFIQIKYGTAGCLGNIGRNWPTSNITMAEKCFQVETALHEIGHVLGMWHEHTRPDRDTHVKVLWENVKVGREYNFESVDVFIKLGLQYDLSSVMHYRSNEFTSGEDKKTLVPLDYARRNVLGQRTRVTFKDSQDVNFRHCGDWCGGSLIRSQCIRGQSLHPKTCRCHCPDGFAGDFCNEIHVTTRKDGTDCGGMLEARHNYMGIFTHDAFPDEVCSWYIYANEGYNIKITITSVGAAWYGDFAYGCLNYVEIKYDGDLTGPGARFCGYNTTIVESLTTEKNEALFISYTTEYDAWVDFTYEAILADGLPQPTTTVATAAATTSAPATTAAGPETTTAAPATVAATTTITTTTITASIDQVECQWSAWSSWSTCSGTCGCAYRMRSRTGSSSCSLTDRRQTEACSSVRVCSGNSKMRKYGMKSNCCVHWVQSGSNCVHA